MSDKSPKGKPSKTIYIAKEGGDYTTLEEAINALGDEAGYPHQFYIRNSKQPTSGEIIIRMGNGEETITSREYYPGEDDEQEQS